MGWTARAAASLFLGLALGLALPAAAQPLSGQGGAQPPGAAQVAPAPLGGPAWVVGQVAELALLDKVTARTRSVSVPVGDRTEFGTVSIAVARCLRRPPEEPAEAAAWLTVTESRAAAGAGPVFSGWMFATSPGLNPLQHPVYDVRVLACR